MYVTFRSKYTLKNVKLYANEHHVPYLKNIIPLYLQFCSSESLKLDVITLNTIMLQLDQHLFQICEN